LPLKKENAMPIKLYNTMTRSAEEFKPLVPGHVGIYTCGPTVYHYAHIGNLRAYMHADMLKRMFLASGYEVRHAMNLTDVGHLTDDGNDGNDKMEKGSARENKSVWEISKMYTEAFLSDMKALNIMSPTVMPKATDYIKEQISLVKRLEELGYTYVIEGDGIYYDTSKFADYGVLTGGRPHGNMAGARIGANNGKRNPETDFALWKFSPKDEKRQMEWNSPWGIGFPGWHIECSAMSLAELGPHFDIHTGGVDHAPIHHTNEIAQSEPIVGKPWVNYWLHFEFLLDKTGKMSKSNGDFLTLSRLAERGFSPMHYRYMIALGHFGSQISFSWESLEAAKNGYNRLVRRIAELSENSQPNAAAVAEWKQKLLDPMQDNLRSSESLAVFQEILRDRKLGDSDKLEIARFTDELLGLGFIAAAGKLSAMGSDIPPGIRELADQRMTAKKSGNYALADELRADLAARGYTMTDMATGYALSSAV
jgi:cysteinyl-tRNA synthetase